MVEKEEGTEETRKKEEKEGGGRNRYCMWSIEPKIVSVWLFIDERARNAKCSLFGRFRCQTEHLPPTSSYTHMLWQGLPCLLKVTLEERDVMERQWRQSQPELCLAQTRP